MEINEMIARINILARKKRSEGLTEEEQCEQKALYKEYLGFIRGQVKQQLDKIEIVDELRTAVTALIWSLIFHILFFTKTNIC